MKMELLYGLAWALAICYYSIVIPELERIMTHQVSRLGVSGWICFIAIGIVYIVYALIVIKRFELVIAFLAAMLLGVLIMTLMLVYNKHLGKKFKTS